MTKIKEMRVKAGLTQEELARRVNLTLRQYQNIEQLKNIPNIKTGLAIAIALKSCPFELFLEEEINLIHEAMNNKCPFS